MSGSYSSFGGGGHPCSFTSRLGGFPLPSFSALRVLVFNAELFDVERVHAALEARRAAPAFERRLRTATLLLAGTFVFTAAASYGLTRWVVTSPAGSEAFNTELGRLTLLSYTLVALPAMAMMMALLLWLARGAKALTGLGLADMLRG